MGWIKKIAEIIHNFFKIHWFWYTIIIAFPTAWFSCILPFWGKWLKLCNESGMTVFGNVISVLLMIIFIGLVFLNNWYSSMTEKGRLQDLEGEIDYLGTITENIDNICDEKYARLRRVIFDIKSGDDEVPKIVTNPNNQLKRILDGITGCLVKFIASPGHRYFFRDFLVSIAYNFPNENNVWEWGDGMIEKDMTLEELLDSDCESTFRHLMKTQEPYYFNNKKENARREHCYCYNKQDELNAQNGDPVGSIFCYNFKIKKGHTVYIDAYLSISTTRKRFSIEDEESCKNTRDNMISLVRDTFGKRIGIELCLLYLDYLKKNTIEENKEGRDV